jgi:hypothetical protein
MFLRTKKSFFKYFPPLSPLFNRKPAWCANTKNIFFSLYYFGQIFYSVYSSTLLSTIYYFHLQRSGGKGKSFLSKVSRPTSELCRDERSKGIELNTGCPREYRNMDRAENQRSPFNGVVPILLL